MPSLFLVDQKRSLGKGHPVSLMNSLGYMERRICLILAVLATLVHHVSWIQAAGRHVAMTKIMVIGVYVLWIVRILIRMHQILEMTVCICIFKVVTRILLRVGHQA